MHGRLQGLLIHHLHNLHLPPPPPHSHRSGSSYLMRSLLRTKSGSFVYVAQVGVRAAWDFIAVGSCVSHLSLPTLLPACLPPQVGDPTHYAVTQDPTQDLAGEGRIWTSPAQDPFLTGTLTRKVGKTSPTHCLDPSPRFTVTIA
jgi:hypothetical protein